jgi:citronellol/citronellal dehydrogenase
MITEQLDFTGRAAIVTGGGTGIGLATARQLAQLGADVVIASRGAEELEASAARIRDESGARCIAVPTDVKDEAAVVRLIEQAMAEFGRIDVLVNNAGGTRMSPLEQIPMKGWDSTFDLNIRSAYVCTREAGQHMIAARRGAIVNISSGAGITGVRGGAHYSAAKSALQMFTRVTAAEWGKHGIRVSCVAPGAIASERAEAAWRAANLDPNQLAGNPMGRTGKTSEIANMIVFLASDAASFVSGQTIAVNGGPVLPGIPDE